MTEDSTSNKQYISYLESVTNNYKETDKPWNSLPRYKCRLFLEVLTKDYHSLLMVSGWSFCSYFI
jgi:hypothetical protein